LLEKSGGVSADGLGAEDGEGWRLGNSGGRMMVIEGFRLFRGRMMVIRGFRLWEVGVDGGKHLKLWRPCRTPIMQQCCRAVRRLQRAVEDGGVVVVVVVVVVVMVVVVMVVVEEVEKGMVPESRHQ
jgi:hypothetical protein